MNLDALRDVKAVYDAFPEGDEKNAMRAQAATVKGFLADGLPALPETDHAAVSFFICELLSGLLAMPVRKIGDVLLDTASAYGLASIDLLGWNGDE